MFVLPEDEGRLLRLAQAFQICGQPLLQLGRIAAKTLHALLTKYGVNP